METQRQKLFFAFCYLVGGVGAFFVSQSIGLDPKFQFLVAIAGSTIGVTVWGKLQTQFETTAQQEAAGHVRPNTADLQSQNVTQTGDNIIILSEFAN